MSPIINADDFGMSTRINAAIIECFQRRLITSTTIMAKAVMLLARISVDDRHGRAREIAGCPLGRLGAVGVGWWP